MEEIKVGTIVQLKSGSPLMTVVLVRDNEQVVCKWFEQNKSNEETFPKAALDSYHENSGSFVTDY